MPIVLKSTNQVTTRGQKFVVYGPSGVGKTRLIATLPNPFIISSEKGLLSLRKFNLPYEEIENIAQANEVVAWWLNSAEAKQFASLAFDTFSDFCEVLLRYEMGRTTNGQKAYGEMANKAIDLLRLLRNGDRHVYLGAKLGMDKDGSDGMQKYAPSAPGKQVSGELGYMFDEVFYYYKGENPQDKSIIRALRTNGNDQYIAKDRSGALLEWEEPHLGNIITKIQSGK